MFRTRVARNLAGSGRQFQHSMQSTAGSRSDTTVMAVGLGSLAAVTGVVYWLGWLAEGRNERTPEPIRVGVGVGPVGADDDMTMMDVHLIHELDVVPAHHPCLVS
ncbi:hypothetical protein FA15DRAFT_659792 [Coprinopsis marcescibilis]|uniref:Uncharacterized protein n=1 Tax=Coprinopsis marcescibilis TaxID=230819 RepID=A0A5C3KHU6_COPMA|nr:hypothetical protein FA15DRAFT_659792 [Coprinopsis marcescibilis]